jgi:membrane-associated protein
MKYRRFITFSVVASLLWISLFLIAGYKFGQLPAVKNNFSLVTIGIILVSVLPVIIGFIKNRMSKA